MVLDYFLSWNLSPEDPFPTRKHLCICERTTVILSLKASSLVSGVGIFKSICELEWAGMGAYLWPVGGDPHSR